MILINKANPWLPEYGENQRTNHAGGFMTTNPSQRGGQEGLK